MTGAGPTYDLASVVELLAARHYRITGEALRGAGELGLDEADIVDCVGALTAACFYKTMEAARRPGFWQDVYRTEHGGIALYVKVQLETQASGDLLVVIQFKRL